MPRRNFLCILVAVVVSLICYRAADRNPYGRYFADVMNKIDQLYIEPVDNQALFDSAIKGMLKNLDRHSDFFGPDKVSQFLSPIDQQYAGIGVQVATDPKTDRLTVLTTFVGSPAYEADIHAGDQILQIDDQPAKDLSVDDVANLIRGEVGTPVRLVLGRAGRDTSLEVKLTRAEVKVDSVLGDTRNADDSWNFHLPGHPEIGYVRITNFGDFTAAELQKAVTALHGESLKGLVLDLRFNGGGRLEAAIDVCSLFLPNGKTVLTTKGRNQQVLEEFRSHGPTPMLDTPLVVLVNGQSASASEIVAACLQDYHRAVVCGQRSYGKGTVQSVLGVERNKSLLKLTIAYYWRPSQRNIHRRKESKDSDEWGVMPEAGFAVDMSQQQVDALREAWSDREIVRKGHAATGDPQVNILDVDPQLKRAVEYLLHAGAAK